MRPSRSAIALAASMTIVLVATSPSCKSSTSDTSADSGIGGGSDGSIDSGGSCTDGIQNNGEIGVDCGGTCLACDGAPCQQPTDCKSGTCPNGTCGPSAGKTCGVGEPKLCADNEACGQPADCSSNYCPNGVCVEPQCKTDADCAGRCDTANGVCLSPNATDGKQDEGETDIDCGGPNAPPCAVGKNCVANSDCQLQACTATKCVIPTNSDGIQNGSESDVDCGGPGVTDGTNSYKAPACNDGKLCNAGTDCGSTFCSLNYKRCVAGQSCIGTGGQTAGLVTCGSRETGDVTAVHEDCCISLPLPTTTTTRLDKYEVTSGRIRQFIGAVGPNLRKWASDAIAANSPLGQRLANDLTTQLVNLLPASATATDPLNLVIQVGGTDMDIITPSMVQGCYNDATSYGANTYWWDVTTLKNQFANQQARRFTQAQYDEKSINCGAYWIYAAFCAWDGGRMPTVAEENEAWGAQSYPWGTSTFGTLDNAHAGLYQYEQINADYFNNTELNYHFPDYGDATDLAGYIAAPGRFILDKTALTSANGQSWMDLGANMMEMTHYTTSAVSTPNFCDFSITNAPGDVLDPVHCTDGANVGVLRASNLPGSTWVGGSWEGHTAFTESCKTTAGGCFPRPNGSFYTFGAQTQYGKTGVRCARGLD